MSINLAPGECEKQVFFNVSATDETSTPTIAQIDGTGYTSGDAFPIGTTTLTFRATDAALNQSTCSFNITIVEYNPPTNALVCDDLLNVSMPATCELWITPEMMLEGNYGCYDDFTVDVQNTGSNYVGYYYVGKTITVKVTNKETGQSCWGKAFIEDKSGPYIQGCDTVEINCLQDDHPVSEGGVVPDPTFIDCNSYSVIWADMVLQGNCDSNYIRRIMRTWTATDVLGNVSSCAQIINVARFSLAAYTPVCPRDTVIECVVGITPNLTPAATGYPTLTVNGTTYPITDDPDITCSITASYQDLIIPKCGASYRIVRSWTVVDWCLPFDMIDNPWTCKQVITYEDKTPPSILPPANMTVGANLPGCRARPVIPASLVSDCSGYTVSITTPVGPIPANGGQVPAPGLPIGIHTITIKATDQCGNASTATFTITVIDNVKPTPVCDAHTVVALDQYGYGFAYATTFDDGSTDNCCIDRFQVARLTDNCNIPSNLTFGDYIEFCCADVGLTLNVVLRVYDCHDNYNECQVEVQVQDIHGPMITCPPDITVTCGTDYTNPTIVGEVVTNPAQQDPNDGLAQDNCGGTLTITRSDAGTVSCGSGLIFRTYKAVDAGGLMAFCVQRIAVINNNPFTGANIFYPADVTVYGCSASTTPDSTGQPTLPPSSGCYTLVTGYTDLLLTSVPDACRKILRTWYVIDWCQYNPNNPTGPGRWEHTQVIKVIDNQAPTFPICDNRTFCNFKADCSNLAPDLSVSATDNCSPAPTITYTWTVDLNDDGIADPGYVTSGVGQNTTNSYPIGTHRISYAASDGCGNTGFCNFRFTIEDCKKPTVYCHNGLIVEMMQGGMVDVNVLQLETGASFDNCTPYGQLEFSFSPVTSDTIRTYTCDDIGVNLVQVWATDKDNNQDYCETFVLIQDNMGECAGGNLVADLTGTVETEKKLGVKDVMIELNGDATGNTLTSNLGQFQFANLPVGYDYTVTPFHNANPLNGVTTYDIVLLNRHILGLDILNSPYKIIAGDVNKNGVLSASDALDIRKLILNVTDKFPNNTSWRFVDANYNFPNTQVPFAPPFPEVCNINDLVAGNSAAKFVAVKIGDLNGNVTTNLLGNPEDRTAGPELKLSANDRNLKAGETVTVNFSADLSGILGYQFTLNFNREALQLESLEPGEAADESNFGMTLLSEGAITASWNQLAAVEGLQSQQVFSLTFRAMADGKLSDMLGVDSRFTKAASFGSDGESGTVTLRFTGEDGSFVMQDRFELYQNMPNPFQGATTIAFHLPEASTATLTIFDVAGKVVKELRGDFSKGFHEVNIGQNELPMRGVFYYRLATPTHTATKKMTVL
jgi:hypothetical protein